MDVTSLKLERNEEKRLVGTYAKRIRKCVKKQPHFERTFEQTPTTVMNRDLYYSTREAKAPGKVYGF